MRLRFWEKTELSVLLAGVIVAGGLWGFVELVEVARDTTRRAFDTDIMLAFRQPGLPDVPLGPAWVAEAARDLTALGSTVVLVLVTAAAFVFLLLLGWTRQAMLVLFAVAGGQLLSSLLKLGIDRPRPDLVSHLVPVQTLSFPSGHAMMSAVTYLTLGSLLAQIVPAQAARVYVLALAVFLSLIVGTSRVYLGVHWPSDVLAGWCLGFAWAMLCWLVARRFLRLDRDTGPPAQPTP